MRVLWTGRSGNRKTGDIPQAWIGATRAATYDSCKGCALLWTRVCYAWTGTPQLGLEGVQRGARRRPGKYTLASALDWRSPSARAVRLSAVGDAGRLPTKALARIQNTVKSAGLALLAYTHHWRSLVSPVKRAVFMASCDNLVEADQALAAGWKVATVVPADEPGPVVTTPAGHKLLMCPALARPGVMTCNKCRLCAPSRLHRYDGIAFRVHGNGAKRYQV